MSRRTADKGEPVCVPRTGWQEQLDRWFYSLRDTYQPIQISDLASVGQNQDRILGYPV